MSQYVTYLSASTASELVNRIRETVNPKEKIVSVTAYCEEGANSGFGYHPVHYAIVVYEQ